MIAQSELALLPADQNYSGVNLGGLVLAPGVYKFDAAASLTGNLVLDGQGMNDAYWVFQIGSTLTTAANANVSVINTGSSGGSNYGIFWNAGTGITFGATNQVLGNYLAGTSITMGAQSSGSGRMLALAAVTFDQNDINAYGGPQSSDWGGGLTYDQSGRLVPIPEPSTSLISCLALLTFMSKRRR